MGGAPLGGAPMGARKPYASHIWLSARQNSPCCPARRNQPVQNSPCRPARRDQPVQNSPGTPQNADFGPVFARRENFLPLSPPTTRAGRTLSRMRGRFRYKTLPASGFDRPTRYKTLPARPKTLISTHFSRAGRTLYRFRHQQPEQGELYPACRAASGTKLSQQAALTGPPGTKLSQQAALAGPPGTKLSQRAPKRRFRPTFRMQGELCTASATNTTSTEKKVTHQHPTSAQQRAPLQISHAIRLHELSTKPRNIAIPTI